MVTHASGYVSLRTASLFSDCTLLGLGPPPLIGGRSPGLSPLSALGAGSRYSFLITFLVLGGNYSLRLASPYWVSFFDLMLFSFISWLSKARWVLEARIRGFVALLFNFLKRKISIHSSWLVLGLVWFVCMYFTDCSLGLALTDPLCFGVKRHGQFFRGRSSWGFLCSCKSSAGSVVERFIVENHMIFSTCYENNMDNHVDSSDWNPRALCFSLGKASKNIGKPRTYDR